MTSSTCTLFVSLINLFAHLLERRSVRVQDHYLLQQEMLHIYRVSLLQISQRVKGDKQCTCNDTKKVVCLLWHTTSLVIKDECYCLIMNYKASCFPEPALDLAKSLWHLHSQLMNHKVYIKSCHTVGILNT